jgi:hypothetical protein
MQFASSRQPPHVAGHPSPIRFWLSNAAADYFILSGISARVVFFFEISGQRISNDAIYTWIATFTWIILQRVGTVVIINTLNPANCKWTSLRFTRDSWHVSHIETGIRQSAHRYGRRFLAKIHSVVTWVLLYLFKWNVGTRYICIICKIANLIIWNWFILLDWKEKFRRIQFNKGDRFWLFSFYSVQWEMQYLSFRQNTLPFHIHIMPSIFWYPTALPNGILYSTSFVYLFCLTASPPSLSSYYFEKKKIKFE